MKILRNHKLNIPVAVLVTDPFTAHPIWFLDKSPQFVVFSDKLKEIAIKKGIPSENIATFPFVIDEQYGNQYSIHEKLSVKRDMGYDLKKKLILVIGGGDGIPKGASIAESIRLLKSDAEIAFVCGRNRKLFNKVIKIKEKYQLNNLKVYGYVDFVHRLLNISDIVVTKCGASTFMEVLMAKKVPIISNYIWEQEKGNMEYVRDNYMGVYEKRVHKLPILLDQLLSNVRLYNTFVSNICQQNIKSGTAEVSQYLMQA